MTRFLLAAAVVLAAAWPGLAVVKVLTPLKQVIDAEEFVFTAEVTGVTPAGPSAAFERKQHLKGAAAVDAFTLDLTGDRFAKQEKHPEAMLDRLEVKRTAVVFASKKGNEYTAFAFTEGTWFQLKGTAAADGTAAKWEFLHAEPYLRRTFKGTTKELIDAVANYRAGKGDPPGPDEKAPPGFGAKLERPAEPPPKKCGGGPPFAVIPTVSLLGPLAILAAFFPVLFARLAVTMKRWRAFLVVASVTTSAALALAFFGGAVVGLMPAVAAVGVVWAGLRYRIAAKADATVTEPPTAGEVATLAGAAAFAWACVGLTAFMIGNAAVREFTAVTVGLATAAVNAAYRFLTRRLGGAGFSSETAALAGVFVFSAWPLLAPPPAAPPLVADTADGAFTVVDVRVMHFPAADEVFSGPTVLPGGKLVVGTRKQRGFRHSGSVICADARTGAVAWTFDAGGTMKPVYSRPVFSEGRVFVGEGLHTDTDTRFFALDAATGHQLWDTTTTGHTEGAAAIDGTRVIFPAGDDGVRCVNAADGKPVWQHRGLHVDAVTAAGGRVFFGGSYSLRKVSAADANTGKELWQTSAGLPSFGPPLVRGGVVYFGLGTGNLFDDVDGGPREQTPAGAVVAYDAATGGEELWRARLPKSVHTPLAADSASVFACGKDGVLTAFDLRTGSVRWRRGVGTTFTAGPALSPDGSAVYAVSRDGTAAAFDPRTGLVRWTRRLAEAADAAAVTVTTTPTVVADDTGRTVYFGAGIISKGGTGTAGVFTVRDQ